MFAELDALAFELSSSIQLVFNLADKQSIEFKLETPSTIGVTTYEGSYEVTPSAETQTLSTRHRYMLDDIIINPIPSDYGHIVYDGSKILVE